MSSDSRLRLLALGAFALASWTGCDSNPATSGAGGLGGGGAGTGASTTASTTAASTTSSGSGVDVTGALVGLTPKNGGTSLVRVDAATGAVVELGFEPTLPGADLAFLDGAVDAASHHYIAVTLNHSDDSEALTFDLTTGALLSRVPTTPMSGLSSHEGTGKLLGMYFGNGLGLGELDPATGDIAPVGDLPFINFPNCGTSNGKDRYHFIGGSDGGVEGTWLFTWDAANPSPQQVDVPQGAKYISAEADAVLDQLFVVTFDAGPTPLVHVASMDKMTAATTLVATLPFTPWSTAPEEVIAVSSSAYDAKAHHFFVPVYGGTPTTPAEDQLYVVDTVSGGVATTSIQAPANTIHALAFVP